MGWEWERVSLQSLNPSLWCRDKILPHPRPTIFAGRRKIAIPTMTSTLLFSMRIKLGKII